MEVDLFPAADFDAWAGTYDLDVLDESRFPFIGYQQVLDTVVRLADVQPGMRLLDLGAGTGNLAAAFAARGCQVWATDYSAQMLARARSKYPQIHFYQADLRRGWLDELPEAFDLIVSAYVFHHFLLPEKVRLVSEFASHLSARGKLILADIAFPDQESLERFRLGAGDDWDDEPYWLADKALAALHSAGLQAGYQQISACAGVFVIELL